MQKLGIELKHRFPVRGYGKHHDSVEVLDHVGEWSVIQLFRHISENHSRISGCKLSRGEFVIFWTSGADNRVQDHVWEVHLGLHLIYRRAVLTRQDLLRESDDLV